MTESEKDPVKIKKPLGASITFGCIIFMTLMSITLAIASYFTLKISLYKRYQSYLTDILRYIERHIDDDDLENCINTVERSEKFNTLERFMDGIKEDFEIHYLYIIKPLAIQKTKNVMSVISAENYFDRYIDTSGNLYLGWISDEEFDETVVSQFFDIMKQNGIVFFEETTEWGTDYTGAVALHNSKDEPYAILAVDVDISEIKKTIQKRTIEVSSIITLSCIIFIIIFLFWAQQNITTPIKLLERSVVIFARKSHGQRDATELFFDAPKINTENEVQSLSSAVTQMTNDMRDYVYEILNAEKKATMMSELAKKDSLTGVRNKTAYDNEITNIKKDLRNGKDIHFGICVVDLNFLKKINDTYGHEKGNSAIQIISREICEVFCHSPVFRIGGDEFAVILKDRDLKNIEQLKEEFFGDMERLAKDENLKPWEKISAALGVAIFDSNIDSEIEDVFRRADKKMYECKTQMKIELMKSL